MSSLLIAFALSFGPADAGSDAKKSEPAAKTERGYHEISKDMQEIMKREALAKSNSDKAVAIVELCDLYRELAGDSRLTISDTLKEYKATIRNRLVRCKNDVKVYLAREKKKTPKSKKPAEVNSELLAAQAQAASYSFGEQMSLISSSLGGPSQIFNAGANSRNSSGALGGGMVTYADDLIDLIERTIAPDTWDTNGGPGSIVYYPGLMALVVRATSEVHGEVNDVLENLREAGR